MCGFNFYSVTLLGQLFQIRASSMDLLQVLKLNLQRRKNTYTK